MPPGATRVTSLWARVLYEFPKARTTTADESRYFMASSPNWPGIFHFGESKPISTRGSGHCCTDRPPAQLRPSNQNEKLGSQTTLRPRVKPVAGITILAA
jgi:hypothetical protein